MVKKDLKKETRDNSIKEGIFWSVESSFGINYISPFAIAINASNSLVALFGSVAGLLGPLSQLPGSRLIEKFSRKKIVLKSVFLEALTWLPLIVIAFLFYKGIIVSTLPLLLLLTFAIFTILAHIGIPAWFSWIGDVVPGSKRGRWFSKRSLIIGFSSVVLAISASLFLDYFKKNDWTMFGFIILFFLAFLARIISWTIFKKHHEPKLKLEKKDYFSFWDFVLAAPKTNFGKFTIFRSFLGFATAVSSPLVAVYLLRHLEFSYSILELWGKFADKYGNYSVLCVTTLMVPIIPILWIISPSPIYLILIPSVVGGIAWAGFNLAAINFIYDNVRHEKTGLGISYYNLLVGIGVFLGAGLGAILIKFLNTSFIEPLLFIFILGGIIRMIAVFWWLPKFKEVRKTIKFKGTKSIKNLILKEGKPTLLEEFHEIASIKKYLRFN